MSSSKLMKFRKKPVVIEAMQLPPIFDIDARLALDDWLLSRRPKVTCRYVSEKLHIPTLEGVMEASPGDWIIQGVKGELYSVKDEIFKLTYEPA